MQKNLALALAGTLALALVACRGGDATGPVSTGGSVPPAGTPADCLIPLVGNAPTASFSAHTSSDLPLLGAGPVSERFTSEVAERGGWAYTATWGRRNVNGNAVKVWDVRGASPVLTDSLLVPNAVTTGDVQISDDGSLLVVAEEYSPNGGISVYDRGDPAHPKLLSHFANGDTQAGVHTAKLGRVNGTLYAFLSIDPSPQQLVIVDLGDPANPKEVLVRPMGNPFVHDVFVRDGLLFTALWNDGFTVWDIGGCGKGGTPSNPVSLLSFKTRSSIAGDSLGRAVHNLYWLHSADGSRRYILVGEEQAGQIGVSSAGDIHVVDMANPNQPKEVAFFHVAGAGTHNFSVDEAHDVLYAAYYNGGVRAVDLRGDLSACDASAKAADGRCDLARAGRELGHGLTGVQSVYIWGAVYDAGRLFASDMVHGLYVLDASSLAH